MQISYWINTPPLGWTDCVAWYFAHMITRVIFHVHLSLLSIPEVVLGASEAQST